MEGNSGQYNKTQTEKSKNLNKLLMHAKQEI
jgi:hypothetical protein